MKERTLHIRIESSAEMFRRVRAAAKKLDAGLRLHAEENLSFADLETYLATFSPRRLELLKHLSNAGPVSIRALSKELERDYKSVHGDVSKLMELDLVVKCADGKIKAPYDRIISDIRLAAA